MMSKDKSLLRTAFKVWKPASKDIDKKKYEGL